MGVRFGYQPYARADRLSVFNPSQLLALCTQASMEVQLHACFMLVAHRPHRGVMGVAVLLGYNGG